MEKKNKDSDSDSSSLPSLEDEQDIKEENTQDDKKKKMEKKVKSAKGQKVSHRVMVYNESEEFYIQMLIVIVLLFYAYAMIIAMAGGVMFSGGPSICPILVNTLSQEG